MVIAVIAVTKGPLAEANERIREIVSHEIQSSLPDDGVGGIAVAVRINGRTVFFNDGFADVANKRPIESDTLFNLASIGKVFDATLLAQAVLRGELAFDDPVSKFIPELRNGDDIRRVTFRQLASHTSGLLLPQDHPPWPEQHYTFPEFLRTLNEWKPEPGHEPGKRHEYTHAGFILLHLAIERRFNTSRDNERPNPTAAWTRVDYASDGNGRSAGFTRSGFE